MVTETILSDPRLYAGLLVALALGLISQQYLGWRRYAQLHALRLLVFPLLHGYKGIFLVSDKAPSPADPEYVGTYDASVRETWQRLVSPDHGDASPHLISSVKRRPTIDGHEYAKAHAVWSHSDGTQTEAYLFAGHDGRTDVYAHYEVGPMDPEAHLDGVLHDGDPRGVVRDAFDGGTLERRTGALESGA